MALEFITAQNFGYNPKVIEGAIKIAQFVSNRTLLPDIVNRKFETAIDEPKLRHIFTSTDDIVCFAQFVVYSMAHNIVDKYEFHPKNSVQPIKKSNKSYQCLVNGCTRICPNYNAIIYHITRSVEKEHVLAEKACRKEWAKGKGGILVNKPGESHLNPIIKALQPKDTLKNVPNFY